MRILSKSLLISMFMVASFLNASQCLAAQTNVTSTLLLNLGAQYDNNFYYVPVDERGDRRIRGQMRQPSRFDGGIGVSEAGERPPDT